MDANQSIHPRVSGGRTVHKKSNTCATPHNPMRGTLAKVTKRLHERQHGRDLSVEDLTRSANKNIDWSKAYRNPGSMKP